MVRSPLCLCYNHCDYYLGQIPFALHSLTNFSTLTCPLFSPSIRRHPKKTKVQEGQSRIQCPLPSSSHPSSQKMLRGRMSPSTVLNRVGKQAANMKSQLSVIQKLSHLLQPLNWVSEAIQMGVTYGLLGSLITNDSDHTSLCTAVMRESVCEMNCTGLSLLLLLNDHSNPSHPSTVLASKVFSVKSCCSTVKYSSEFPGTTR